MSYRTLPPVVVIDGPLRVDVPPTRDSGQAVAAYLWRRAGESLGNGQRKRPRLRLCAEVLCDWNGKRRYHRVVDTACMVDAESPEQLELVWDAIVQLLRSVDGKYMAPRSPSPAPADPPESE